MFNNKFNVDIIWNLIALAIIALCGFSLNILIGRFYGPEVLGIFNLVMAVYVTISHLSVGGVHFSVLRYSSEYFAQKETVGSILSGGLMLAFGVSLITCFCVWLGKDLISHFFNSNKVTMGVLYALPGLFFFSLNKVFSAVTNGMRHMRMFAFTNALRGLLILGSILYLYHINIDPIYLPLCFSCSEPVIFVIFSVYLLMWNRIPISCTKFDWLGRHGSFGFRGIFTGLLMDLNLRIDVLLLGHLTTERIVGIYSMASMIAEGIYQIPIVFQTNVNPILTSVILARQMNSLKKLVSRINLIIVPLMAIVSIILYFSYTLIAVWLTGNDSFIQGQVVFGILALGMTLSSGYACFGNVLSQGGHPGVNTIFFLTIVFTNIVLNLLLIPSLGIIGSAAATCLAYLLSTIYLKGFIYRIYKVWV